MRRISFADVVHQSISFHTDIESENVVLKIIDTPWFQRLRDVSQTANTRLVYMFSEHTRFGHCVGTAYLACNVMQKLKRRYPEIIGEYEVAVAASAALHDIGHLAPGSHMAQKLWFPDESDSHEQLGIRIIKNAPEITALLESQQKGLTETVCRILSHDPTLPPWTWELIAGGGWNVDRGNWCIVDSIMAGVSYGRYNIPALTDSLVLTDEGRLALRENRLDAMLHFAVSRHAMYTQMYQHRVILAADMISQALVKRLREKKSSLSFADNNMLSVLEASSIEDLTLDQVFWMREGWWRYHLMHWINDPDPIIADLSERIINRRLFKTVRIRSEEDPALRYIDAENAVRKAGYDPEYYLHNVISADMHAGDSKQSLLVQLEDDRIHTLRAADPVFETLLKTPGLVERQWLVMPEDARAILLRR